MQESRRTFDWEQYLKRKKRNRRWTMLILAVLLPGLLFMFYFLFQNRHYLFFGIMILMILIGSFVINFERRHPRAREIVLLSVMTSLTVAANEICAHTIPVHAGTALVVLSGIGLGPESGFLIGALSRFLCNFFDGQGPWTPWQMTAWGLLGFLAGSLFNKTVQQSKLERTTLARRLSLEKEQTFRALTGPLLFLLVFWLAGYLSFLFFHEEGETFFGWRIYAFGIAGLIAGGIFQRKRLPADTITVTVFTFFSVLLIYGGIMNFAAMLFNTSYQTDALTLETLKALYITGFPYDLSHAGFAALCVFLFGDGILQRLQRLCIKFGIVL